MKEILYNKSIICTLKITLKIDYFSMKDILKKYKKHKNITNIGIVIASLILAIWFNLFVIDGSDFGTSMRANILEAKSENNRADVYWEYWEDTINIYSSKNMNNVKNISLSLSYNPNNVEIVSQSSESGQILKLNSENGIHTILLNYSPEKNIIKNNVIFSIQTNKSEEISEQINIFNANFTDTTGETYLLSTSGITF